MVRVRFTLATLAALSIAAVGCVDDTSANGAVDVGTDDVGADVPDDGGDASADASSGRGPGLGNLEYDESELFQVVGWVDQAVGMPSMDLEFPSTVIKPYGTNVAYMLGGYMLTLFASDSGGGPGGLLVLDVSDPRAPSVAHMVYEPHDATGEFREAHSMGFARVADRTIVVFHTAYGVEFWDFTEMTSPVQLSRLHLDGVDSGDYENVAWQLFWQGNYVYVAGSTRGLYIVDASDPSAPVMADRGAGRPNPVPTSELGGFRVGPVFAVGNMLVLSSMDTNGGFASLDISDPVNPVVLATRTRELPTFYSACFGGGRLATSVRGRGARMGVFDLSNPFRIERIDESVVIDEMLYCAFQDDFVFQGGEDDFVKIDLSEAGSFHEVGRGALPRENADNGQVTLFGNLVFIGNDHGTGSAFVPHQVAPDTTPPRVDFVVPLDGEALQALTSRIGVTFSDNVELESIDTHTFSVRPIGGDVVPGRFTVQGSFVNFQPDEELEPATTYEVVVAAGGVRDWAGNATSETFRSTFTTADVAGGDAVAPRVTIDPVSPTPVGEEVAFQTRVDGAGDAQVSWSFGDGSDWTAPSASLTASHAFARAGHYTVVARVSNGHGWAAASTRVTAHDSIAELRSVQSSTLALDDARGRIWAANRDNGTVTVVDTASHDVLDEIPVGGSPSSVAVDGSGRVWVTIREPAQVVRFDGETLAELDREPLPRGSAPAGVASDPRGRYVAVTLEALGRLLVFPSDSGDPVAVELGPTARGIGIAGHVGDDAIYVSRFISADEGGTLWRVPIGERGLPDGEAEVLALAVDTTTEDAEDRGRGVPNYVGAPAFRPGTGEAWIPATSANIFRGRYRDGLDLTFDSTVRAVVPRLSSETGAEIGRRLDLNDRALPSAVGFTALGDWAFVVLEGSNEVRVIDAFTGAAAGVAADVGAAPQAFVVSADGRRAYVHGFLSRTVEVLDLGGLVDGVATDPPTIATVATVGDEALAPEVLRGKRIFYDASDPRMSRDGYIACALCHIDGGHDGRTWDFTDRGEGLRNTVDLRGRAGTGHGPVHWTANFDEIQDFENDIRGPFGGRGFLTPRQWQAGTRSDPLGDRKAGLGEELDALAAYVRSLDSAPTSPYRGADGELTEAAARGESVFHEVGCAECHARPTYTDSGSEGATGEAIGPLHDVGTITAASGSRIGGPLTGLDTPTLLGVWAGAPYLHDGSAPTLFHVMLLAPPGSAHSVESLSEDDFDALVRYMSELE